MEIVNTEVERKHITSRAQVSFRVKKKKISKILHMDPVRSTDQADQSGSNEQHPQSSYAPGDELIASSCAAWEPTFQQTTPSSHTPMHKKRNCIQCTVCDYVLLLMNILFRVYAVYSVRSFACHSRIDSRNLNNQSESVILLIKH